VRKQGYQEVARQVTLRSGALTGVTLKLKEAPRYTPWIAEVTNVTRYRLEPTGRESRSGGLWFVVHTKCPRELRVTITDGHGRKYALRGDTHIDAWEGMTGLACGGGSPGSLIVRSRLVVAMQLRS